MQQTPVKQFATLKADQLADEPKKSSSQQYMKAFQKVTTILKQKEEKLLDKKIDNSKSISQISLTDITDEEQVKPVTTTQIKQKLNALNKKSRNSADLYNSQKINGSNNNNGVNYFSLKTRSSRNGLNGDYNSWNNQNQGGKLFQTLRNELSFIEQDSLMLQNYESAKYSTKRNGIITAYGANTNQGIIRTYNEDRVAIILNIMKPKNKETTNDYWPKCSFFGIYDGHGGSQCAEFLRDYLHQFIIKDDNFPSNPIQAIRNGFREAERLFLEFAEKQEAEIGDIDRSGSCAIVIIIIDEMCYVANVGDSRAIMSADGGEKIFLLSTDHKPTEEVEMKRIVENGGRIYQNSSVIPGTQATKGQQQIIMGPHRVFPGRLSVSRTFGDIEAKLTKYEGNPNVVVAEPDVTAFRIRNNYDFIVLACDGIFDKLNNKDAIHLAWQSVQASHQKRKEENNTQTIDVHQHCGLAVDAILRTSALRKSCDNITAVFIAFDNFENLLQTYKAVDNQSVGIKEEQIEEILLEPIPDLELQKMQELEEELPTEGVLYLQNDDALDDELENEEVGALYSAKKMKIKIPKNNMLSEISEEDDVSMQSERKDLIKGNLKSMKSSRVQSNRKLNTLNSKDIQQSNDLEKKVLQSNSKISNTLVQKESLGQLLSQTFKSDNRQLGSLLDNQVIKRQNSHSRNGLRQALSQKSQTQQIHTVLEQVNLTASIQKVRPISGSKRRLINSNGFAYQKGSASPFTIPNAASFVNTLQGRKKSNQPQQQQQQQQSNSNINSRNQMKIQKVNLAANLTQTMQIPTKIRGSRNQFLSQRWQSYNRISNGFQLQTNTDQEQFST